MAVYVDPMMACIPNRNWRWKENCHLYSDEVEELHRFAIRLGMKRNWFQNHTLTPHYDLTRTMRAKALRLGAVDDANCKNLIALRRIARWRIQKRLLKPPRRRK